MARKFSLPQVAALEVGQSAWLTQRASVVKQKVVPFGHRHGRAFEFKRDPAGVEVTRLPDPEPQP